MVTSSHNNTLWCRHNESARIFSQVGGIGCPGRPRINGLLDADECINIADATVNRAITCEESRWYGLSCTEGYSELFNLGTACCDDGISVCGVTPNANKRFCDVTKNAVACQSETADSDGMVSRDCFTAIWEHNNEGKEQ